MQVLKVAARGHEAASELQPTFGPLSQFKNQVIALRAANQTPFYGIIMSQK